MRKVKEVLRLKWACGFSDRKIAKSCGIARSTLAKYLRRAEAAGLSCPLPAGLDEAALEQKLFPVSPVPPTRRRPVPVWADIDRELKRKGVTLFLLWQEYQGVLPGGPRIPGELADLCRRVGSEEGRNDLGHMSGEKFPGISEKPC